MFSGAYFYACLYSLGRIAGGAYPVYGALYRPFVAVYGDGLGVKVYGKFEGGVRKCVGYALYAALAFHIGYA